MFRIRRFWLKYNIIAHLKKSFQSIDYDIASETFEWIIDGYINTYSDDLSKNEIKNKIKNIESRGRYTH